MTEEERRERLEREAESWPDLKDYNDLAGFATKIDPEVTEQDRIHNMVVERLEKSLSNLFFDEHPLVSLDKKDIIDGESMTFAQLKDDQLASLVDDIFAGYDQINIPKSAGVKYKNIEEAKQDLNLDKRKTKATRRVVIRITEGIIDSAMGILGNIPVNKPGVSPEFYEESKKPENIEQIVTGKESDGVYGIINYCPLAGLKEEDFLKIYNGEAVDGVTPETSAFIRKFVDGKVTKEEYTEFVSKLYKETLDNYIKGEIDNSTALTADEKESRKKSLIATFSDGNFFNENSEVGKSVINARARDWINDKISAYIQDSRRNSSTKTEAELIEEASTGIFENLHTEDGKPYLDPEGNPIDKTSVQRQIARLKLAHPDRSEEQIKNMAIREVARQVALCEIRLHEEAVIAGGYEVKSDIGGTYDTVKGVADDGRKMIESAESTLDELDTIVYQKMLENLGSKLFINEDSSYPDFRAIMFSYNDIEKSILSKLTDNITEFDFSQEEIEQIEALGDTSLNACVRAIQNVNQDVMLKNFAKVFGNNYQKQLREFAGKRGPGSDVDPLSKENVVAFVENYIDNRQREYVEECAVNTAKEILRNRGIDPTSKNYARYILSESKKIYSIISEKTLNRQGMAEYDKAVADGKSDEEINKLLKKDGMTGLLPDEITEERLAELGIDVTALHETETHSAETAETPLTLEETLAKIDNATDVYVYWLEHELNPLFDKYEAEIKAGPLSAEIIAEFDAAANKKEYYDRVVDIALSNPLTDEDKGKINDWYTANALSDDSLGRAKAIITAKEADASSVSDEDYNNAIVVKNVFDGLADINASRADADKYTMATLPEDEKHKLYVVTETRISACGVIGRTYMSAMVSHGVTVARTVDAAEHTSGGGTPSAGADGGDGSGGRSPDSEETADAGKKRDKRGPGTGKDGGVSANNFTVYPPSLEYSSIDAQLELLDLALSAMEKAVPVFSTTPPATREEAGRREETPPAETPSLETILKGFENEDEVYQYWLEHELNPLFDKYKDEINAGTLTPENIAEFDAAANKIEYYNRVASIASAKPLTDEDKGKINDWFTANALADDSLDKAKAIIEAKDRGDASITDEAYQGALAVKNVFDGLDALNATRADADKFTMATLPEDEKHRLYVDAQARTRATSKIGEIYKREMEAHHILPSTAAAEEVEEISTGTPKGVHEIATTAFWHDVSVSVEKLIDPTSVYNTVDNGRTPEKNAGNYRRYIGNKALAIVALASGKTDDIDKYGYTQEELVDEMIRENFEAQSAAYLRQAIESGALKPLDGADKVTPEQAQEWMKLNCGELVKMDEDGKPDENGRLRVQLYNKEGDAFVPSGASDVFPKGADPATHSNLTVIGLARTTVYAMLQGKFNVSDPRLSDDSVSPERRNQHLYNAFVKAGLNFDFDKYVEMVKDEMKDKGLADLGIADALTEVDEAGNPKIPSTEEPLLDANGEAIVDEEGNPVMAQVKEVDGVKVYMDTDGNVIDIIGSPDKVVNITSVVVDAEQQKHEDYFNAGMTGKEEVGATLRSKVDSEPVVTK